MRAHVDAFALDSVVLTRRPGIYKSFARARGSPRSALMLFADRPGTSMRSIRSVDLGAVH